MNLNFIIKDLSFSSIQGNTDIEVTDLIYDSRKVKNNSVFVCLKGCSSDGHDFISNAVNAGAKVIVTNKEINIPGVTNIVVENTRLALAHMSANFFGHPAEKIKTIGITGTKGKTTTSFMIKSILESSKIKAGIIGTMGVILDNEIIPLCNTTPESYEVQKYLNLMVQKGYEFAIIEASSIGLARNRLDAFTFDYGIFTNFSHDHIGDNEHKSYEEYLQAKSLLFRKCKTGFINVDDENHLEIIKNHSCKIVTFGITKSADYLAKDLKLTNEENNIGVHFNLAGKINIENIFISVPGKFNVYNSLAAISLCDSLGIKSESIISGLKKVKIKGRVEPVVNRNGYSIFIDYAHNALSMENVLKTLREYNPKRIITLFGAGGNRPKVRRFEMGETAGILSDLCVITSDNPRFEDPLEIIKDIKEGIDKTKGNYVIVPNRKEAIKYCIENAKSGDMILLAGKGHEDYQEIKGVKYPFDERLIVSEILKNL